MRRALQVKASVLRTQPRARRVSEEVKRDPPGGPSLAGQARRAWVGLRAEDHEAMLMGNAEGLQRLARIIEQCASDTPESREYRSCGDAAKDLMQVAGGETALLGIELLQEPPAHPVRKSRIRDLVALVGCGLLVYVAIMVFCLGLAAMAGFIPLP